MSITESNAIDASDHDRLACQRTNSSHMFLLLVFLFVQMLSHPALVNLLDLGLVSRTHFYPAFTITDLVYTPALILANFHTSHTFLLLFLNG